MRAYAECYLEDAMDNLGAMYDYAVYDLGMTLEHAHSMFLMTGMADDYGVGRPYIVAGHSGVELASMLVYRSTGKYPETHSKFYTSLSPEYWAGWILAYFQWYTGMSFRYIENHGLKITDILGMYHPLHEADQSKFVQVAEEKIERFKMENESPLKTYRRRLAMSQQDLANLTGVSLRMIRAYEQKKQEMASAEALTVFNLSKALQCRLEDLI